MSTAGEIAAKGNLERRKPDRDRSIGLSYFFFALSSTLLTFRNNELVR